MPVEVHREFLQRRFVATWCSLACLLNFIIITGAGILPLYIAWASHSFWIREALKWEQLDVRFTHSLIVSVHGRKGALQTPFQYVWTTSPNANDLLGGAARAPIVKVTTADENLDGKVDEYHMSIRMPLAADEAVYGVKAAAFLDVNIHTATRAKFDALAITEHWTPIPGTQLIADGDLVFLQRDSLPFPSAGIYAPYMASPLINLDTATSSNDVLLSSVVEQYRARNYTVKFDVPHPVWRTEDGFSPVTPGSTQDMTAIAYQPRSFELKMIMRAAPTGVRVRPGVPEELKHGWIQYLSFLVITATLAWLLRKLIFGMRLVETHVYVDAPRTKLHIH